MQQEGSRSKCSGILVEDRSKPMQQDGYWSKSSSILSFVDVKSKLMQQDGSGRKSSSILSFIEDKREIMQQAILDHLWAILASTLKGFKETADARVRERLVLRCATLGNPVGVR